jgi:predicted nucleotidyltransferase
MILDNTDYERKIALLGEREKELKCLYKVHEIVRENLPVDKFLMEIVRHIWGGWQHPVVLRVKIEYEGNTYCEPGWTETEWVQSADIIVDDKVCGKIEVYYIQYRKPVDGNNPFLPEEQKLLNTIAANVGTYIYHNKLVKTLIMLEREKNKETAGEKDSNGLLPVQPDVHWIWRNEMVHRIAAQIDPGRFGVKAMYLIGSVKNATAGPASDIDIMIHFAGDERQEKELRSWFEGWSLCLSEINRLKTGYTTDGLIDLHIITERDIEAKTSYASMIGATSDGARLIMKRD